MTKLLLSFLAILFSAVSQAGNSVGNGGDVIVCYNHGTITSVTFYDLIEAEKFYGLTIKQTEPGSYTSKLQDLISRIETINPTRAKLYALWAREFTNEAIFMEDAELLDIADTHLGVVPNGCDIRQGVVHKEPFSSLTPKRYTVNQTYWNLMDDNSKAALVLHELIYRELITYNGHTDSVRARYFHALIQVDLFRNMPLGQFLELLCSLGIQQADAHGNTIGLLGSHDSFKNGKCDKKTAFEMWNPTQLKRAGLPRTVGSSTYPLSLKLFGKPYYYQRNSTSEGVIQFSRNGNLELVKEFSGEIEVGSNKISGEFAILRIDETTNQVWLTMNNYSLRSSQMKLDSNGSRIRFSFRFTNAILDLINSEFGFFSENDVAELCDKKVFQVKINELWQFIRPEEITMSLDGKKYYFGLKSMELDPYGNISNYRLCPSLLTLKIQKSINILTKKHKEIK